jgi:3-oxoacyl-[acyl-carrier protein] reductase
VVTGAGSGMGSSFARRCAEEGARVVLTDVNEASVGRVASDIGAEAMVFDVTSSTAFTEAIDRVVDRYGRIDGLVNNAGIAPVRDPQRTGIAIANQMLRMEGRLDELTPTDDTVDLTDDQWNQMIAVHLNGTFYGTRAALSHMTRAKSGSIVNISSILGLRPSAGAPHYCAAKAGIIALTKSVAHEVAPFGVRVNVVCPGWVDTPLLEPFEDTVKAAIRMQIPIGRMATPAELSEMIVFMLGPQSSYCIGDVFPVTGGWV